MTSIKKPSLNVSVDMDESFDEPEGCFSPQEKIERTMNLTKIASMDDN